MYTKEFIADHLAEQCHSYYQISTKRPGIYQVSMPIFYEDGDAVEIFIEKGPEGTARITDYGMALMRLSYDYDVDTPNKESILHQMLAENRLKEDEGKIYIDVAPEDMYPGILQLAGGISKIGSMKYFRREIVHNLFYETVENFIVQKLADRKPQVSYYPIPGREELEVEYLISTPIRPLYIYAVKGNDKAKNVIINCLSFQKEKLPFTSIIIHENMDTLNKKVRALLTNTVDKQYSSFDAFSENINGFIERESMTTAQTS